MARAAVPGRLSWRVATVKETRDETATARTLLLDVPGWPGHVPGQHVAVKLTAEDVTVDIHCVTQWSKLGTRWRGVSVDTLLDGIETSAGYVMARSYGGYTTNMPLADLRDGKAWVAYSYDGRPLPPEHGGPARLLVPHLYFWKSAKWVRAIQLMTDDQPGFWESLGYHNYGDPWREQRYQGD